MNTEKAIRQLQLQVEKNRVLMRALIILSLLWMTANLLAVSIAVGWIG